MASCATGFDANVSAIVSRGGRADMAAERLAKVKTPTLLIVGGNDDVVLDLKSLEHWSKLQT